MRKLLALLLMLLASTASAQQINFFPPPGMNYNFSTTSPIVSVNGTTNAQVNLSNSSLPSGQKVASLLYGNSGLLELAPSSDSGVPSTTDFFTVISSPVGTTPKLGGLQYSDTTSCGGTGMGWSINGGDMQVQAANCAPAITVQDTGSTAAAAAIFGAFSTAGNGGFACAPNNNQFSGGVTTNACYFGTGLTNTGTGNIPLVFGTNHVFAGQIFAADQGWAVGAPTGGDKGSGTLNAQGLFVQGTAVSTAAAANPTASAGLTAVNGSATTFMRSDGAPAISQSIAPTWTGQHTFTTAAVIGQFGGTAGGQRFDGTFAANSATPSYSLNNTGGGSNSKDWAIDGSTTAHLKILGFDDTKSSSFTYLDIQRSATGVNPVGVSVGTGLISTGTKFTTSGCSVSSTTGGAAAGTFTLGANSCTVVITIAGATGATAPNGWNCMADDQTALTILVSQSASTTTTCSINIPVTAGTTDVIRFIAMGY